jgi:uncharacterized membrane protein
MEKLKKDFGIRALIAVIAGCAFYAVVFFILTHFELEVASIIALATSAQAPFLAALAFYFGERASSASSKKEGKEEDKAG